jgi:hypothetical protein
MFAKSNHERLDPHLRHFVMDFVEMTYLAVSFELHKFILAFAFSRFYPIHALTHALVKVQAVY